VRHRQTNSVDHVPGHSVDHVPGHTAWACTRYVGRSSYLRHVIRLCQDVWYQRTRIWLGYVVPN